MAKPINHTPILKGKDAVDFFNLINQNKDKKVDSSFIASIKKDAEKLKSIFRN